MPSLLPGRAVAGLRPATDVIFPDDGLQELHGLWVDTPFPAHIRGVDAHGERFALDAVLDTLGPQRLYVRLPRPVEPGANLFVVVRLSPDPTATAPCARIAVRGEVVRTDAQPDGRCGAAVAFPRHRFLYASTGC